MTDEEAQQVSNCSDVLFVDLDKSKYPDEFPPAPDQLHTATRYTSTVKNYYNFAGLLPVTPDSTDANRAGYQLLRPAQYANPWFGQSASTVINNSLTNSNTGRNVDLIVGDEGCWFGHADFQSNPTGGVALPRGFVGGNKLPGNGTCMLLDVVLEGPYYIDPAWFNASPGSRLTTRWDGTTVPVEQVARDWWSNASQRSAQFATAGTVAIPGTYTRANCNGTNAAEPPFGEGQHGTACSGLAYGRTYGWAYNANKWVVDAYGSYGFGINVNLYFDLIKIFHLNKPVNPATGTRDPTVSSNSWGFRATVPSTGFYYFRQGTTGSGGVAYTGTKPEFMRYIGSAGDSNRCKGEMVPNTLTTAGDELIASGVIFVVAAGNSNQQQVSSDHPNFNNYWATANSVPLLNATHDEFGSLCYNTTGRRGFPQQLGKFDSGGNVVYPAINIGALDDQFTAGGLERKVNYSDMGNQIDVYTPADGTLTSNASYSPEYARFDQTPGGITSFDCRFSGTSAACPVAAGFITAQLETNRSWGWQDVRTWLQSLTQQSASTFYQGPDPQTATSVDWADLNSLMGGTRRVAYNTVSETVSFSGAGLSFSGVGLTINAG
jgi:hypothetical protein